MHTPRHQMRWFSLIGILALLVGGVAPLLAVSPAAASDTPDPSTVTIVGSLQSELGCPTDWDPACLNTQLTFDSGDGVWQNIFDLPPGDFEYKAALNGSWSENYGANAVRDGANISLPLAAATSVKFYYDHETHWITSNLNSRIATAPGSYQSEIGCGGDWDPSCLRSWLQDTDGDGIYAFSTSSISAGDYEFKVAIDEGWAENYGAGGVPGGANILFTVPAGDMQVTFTFDSAINLPSVEVIPLVTPVTIVGSLQSELGCATDWDPACAFTELIQDYDDLVYQQAFNVPAGSYEYKAALNRSWDENYGANATPNGANIPLNLVADTPVKFYYDDVTHWVTDNFNNVIATVPGSFQSELGCPGDWDPACLRSWLQDPDGDGTYSFSTSALLAGNYEAKVAIDESWAENYGQGGAPGGANILFSVPVDNIEMTFSYDPISHILTISAANQSFPDNNVEWDGVRHDSRDLLYRTPGGAQPAGADVTVRLRTFHNDVTSVRLRTFDLNANNQVFYDLHLAAADVSCYQADLEYRTCDFWEVTLSSPAPNNIWYRFIVTDGTDTDFYADNTSALDGGLGAVSDDAVDNSYALMFYDPQFTTPEWLKSAYIYQIFPDRFRNANPSNDPETGDVRYDDPVLALEWGTLPEGYCRNYADAPTNCPWRFDDTPPDYSPIIEGPRGRDYFGGDLQGVIEKLPYLQGLGVTAIYFNPIFDAQSNHRYDTADYYAIDPYLGSLQTFRRLVRTADRYGIRIILDGVFNHMSSDSPIFDRYLHYDTLGACESPDSPYRSWFNFRPPSSSEPDTCAPSTPGGNDTYYDGWFGFDSIPVINKSNPEVQDYFIFNADSVSRYWLDEGAYGWRQDVMGDSSFPNGYWEAFRQIVKSEYPDTVIIGELWQKDSTLLRFLRGDRADSTMNYRLRDAVLGLLSTGPFDSKGFGDSGRVIEPSEFAARIASIQEDYPETVYYSLMNLLGSHDTERLLWALTPGTETLADKQENPANLAEGKRRQQIAAMIQFTMPGAPTVYYGDEVGITGDDDPDDRRTFPWSDLGFSPDLGTWKYYRVLSLLRSKLDALTKGDLKVLLADDAAGTVAYGRKTGTQAVLVVINRSSEAQTVSVPIAGYLPDGVSFLPLYNAGSKGTTSAVSAGGTVQATLAPLSAVLLGATYGDFTPPSVPDGLAVEEEGDQQVSLEWNAVSGAAGYNLYRSVVSGGGWVKVNLGLLTETSFTDTGLENARTYFYTVTSLDAKGNESGFSNQVSALPHYDIGWANTQWPPSITHTISAVNRTDTVYGQVWIDGVTSAAGPTESLLAQLGFGPEGSDPAAGSGWTWVDASFNVDVGNNDEFMASMLPDQLGTFDYLYRYSTTAGRDWLYADFSGPIPAGGLPSNPGKLTVVSSGDLTPPDTPTGLVVVSASPEGIELAWNPVPDADLFAYEVLRSDTGGGPYDLIGLAAGATGYTDTSVGQGMTYFYVVRAVDLSFNRSDVSNEVEATAALRTVTVTFNVTVPATTPAGSTVFIAGTLSRLDGGYPDWDPGGVSLTQVDPTNWTITFTGSEATQVEYKYTLGSWDYVEKGATCEELSNRVVTLSYGSTGIQTVNDTVFNWRNVSPCGN